jgi:hypothetical protein
MGYPLIEVSSFERTEEKVSLSLHLVFLKICNIRKCTNSEKAVIMMLISKNKAIPYQALEAYKVVRC